MVKKMIKLIANIFLFSFIVLGLAMIVITITAKKDSDGATNIFNYQLRVVLTDSMNKCDNTDVSKFKIKSIPKNSLIVIKKANDDKWYENIKVGDVLTFRYVYTEQVTITHRVKSITPKDDGGYIIELVGDNKNSETSLLSQTIDTSVEDTPNYIIGKVVYKSIFAGFILSALKKPIGLVFMIIIPSFIIIILEIIKILNVFIGEKRKKEQEESVKKEQEILELKRRLEEMENRKL